MSLPRTLSVSGGEWSSERDWTLGFCVMIGGSAYTPCPYTRLYLCTHTLYLVQTGVGRSREQGEGESRALRGALQRHQCFLLACLCNQNTLIIFLGYNIVYIYIVFIFCLLMHLFLIFFYLSLLLRYNQDFGLVIVSAVCVLFSRSMCV